MPGISSYNSIVSDANSPVAGVQAVVDPNGSIRVAQRPLDYTGPGSSTFGGHFRAGLVTGKTTGLTAGQPIMSLRWTDTSHYFVLLGLKMWANIDTAFTTAQLVDAALVVARAYTAVDSGGTASIPANNMNKMRDSGGQTMQASLLNDMRIATTGTLTAGTRTLDTLNIAAAQFGNSNALGNASEAVELYSVAPYDHPLVLGANEGLVVTVPTAQGAVGKVVYYVNLKWAEVVAF